MSDPKNRIEELVKIAELSISAELEAIDKLIAECGESSIGKVVGLIEAKSRMKSYAVAQYISSAIKPVEQKKND